MKLQNIVLAISLAAGVGMISTLIISPEPAQSSEVFAPEQLFSTGQISTMPEMDCHNGNVHWGNGEGIDTELDGTTCICWEGQTHCYNT